MCKEKETKESTALSRRAKRGASKGVEGALLLGVRHDNAVVLGGHVALDALAILGAALVDVVADKAAADKGDGLNLRSVAHGIDDALATLHHVQDAIRPQTLAELREDLGSIVCEIFGNAGHVDLEDKSEDEPRRRAKMEDRVIQGKVQRYFREWKAEE